MSTDSKEKKLPKGIRRRKSGLYEARFTYKGELYTLYNTNLKLLQSEIAEKRYEVEHGLYAKESNVTVDSWFYTWMEEYKKNSVKYGTYKVYLDKYKSHIKEPFGRKHLKDIRGEHIQKLFNDMARRYSSTTINLVKVILSGMYTQAVRNGMVLRNPVKNTSVKKEKKKKKIRVMSIEEQNLFMRYSKNSQFYDLYMVALGTGMRNGELRALQWADIDFDNKIIHVNGTLKYIAKAKVKYMIDEPKSETSKRDIPMLDNLVTVLREHRKRQLATRMLLGDKWRPEPGFENLVFTGSFGRCISENALYQDMKKIIVQIREDGHTFGEHTPHSLRHTFATRGFERGIPPKVMQEILGHKSITMTLDIYSHVLPDKKAEEINKLAAMF